MTDLIDADLAMAAALKALQHSQAVARKADQALQLANSVTLVRGPRGYPGKDGYNPMKGVDYRDGEKGATGEQGVGIKSIDESKDNFTLILDDGRKYPIAKSHGENGQNGKNGQDGKDGVGVKSAYIENGYLFIALTNGDSIRAGYVRGDKGEPGPPGPPGKSGPVPEHEIRTDKGVWKLRFRHPNGRWGKWIDIPRRQTVASVASGGAPTVAYPPRRVAVRASVNTILAAYPLYIVKVDTTGGDVRITLPKSNSDYDMEIIVKKTPENANKVIVDTEDGRLINGMTEFEIELSDTAIHFIDDGTTWDAV